MTSPIQVTVTSSSSLTLFDPSIYASNYDLSKINYCDCTINNGYSLSISLTQPQGIVSISSTDLSAFVSNGACTYFDYSCNYAYNSSLDMSFSTDLVINT